MTLLESLSVGDLFLADPIQITKNNVKVRSSRWSDIDTISVTHNRNRAITDRFIAEVRGVSNGVVQARKVTPEGPRMVLPGDEIDITVDTIAPDETLVADVSAAKNINRVYPLENSNLGASLKIRIVQTSGKVAYADVLSVQNSGVTVGDRVDVQLERGSSTAKFETSNLDSFTCRLDREPTAGGPGVVRVTGHSVEGIQCELEEVEHKLGVGERYEMKVERGDTQATVQWEDAVGVPHVSLEHEAEASTMAVIELTKIKGSVKGQIVEYQNVPEIGSKHRISLDRGQDVVVIDGVPVHLESESKISGEGTVEITGHDVPRNGRIIEYHELPKMGSTATITLDHGQDFLLLDGVPIELKKPSRINGDVTIKITGDGLPFEGSITEYDGLPDVGEIIDSSVSRGTSEVVVDGIPIRFSPVSRVGGLNIRLKVVDENPPVDAELIDYPSLDEGSTVRATVGSDDLSVAHARDGDYAIDLIDRAEKPAAVRVRLVTVTPELITGKIDGYLSIGSTGQNFGRDSKKKSPFRQDGTKNDEITGKKL